MGNAEKILGYINVYKGITNFTVFFTTDRVLVAKTTGLGTLLIGGPIAHKYLAGKTSRELDVLSPENVISADKKNYAIPYSEIIKLHLKKPRTFRDGKITILTNKGEQKFGIAKMGLVKLHEYDFEFLQEVSHSYITNLVME